MATKEPRSGDEGCGGSLLLYGYPGSINVRKVLWVCDELGLRVEREDWGGGTRSPAEPRFRALNPVGMVPVIDDGGVIVWESNVIVRYLASSRGRVDLLPVEPAARAHVEQWMDWQGSDFNNSWRYVLQGLVRRHPDFQDPVALARSQQQFTEMVGIVDARVRATGAFIAGAAFTVADIPIGLSAQRWHAMPFDKPTLPDLERYLDRLGEHPGFVRFGGL